MASPAQPVQTVSSDTQSFSPRVMVIACSFAVLGVLQMLTNGRYGYFRDELYFIATSKHLALGYVDFAPLSALVLRVSRAMFGDSLHAIRFLPALAYGGEILLTALITTELGGKRVTVFLVCVSVLVAPVIVGNAIRFSMNPFEPLLDGLRVFFCACDPAGQPKSRDVQEGPTLDPKYGMGEEHYTILICHGLKEPLPQVWSKLKVWN